LEERVVFKNDEIDKPPLLVEDRSAHSSCASVLAPRDISASAKPDSQLTRSAPSGRAVRIEIP
jgi:hypothetical protein